MCDGCLCWLRRMLPTSTLLQGWAFNEMRSKTKTLDVDLGLDASQYPDWSFDGSSTGQAEGKNSDCILRSV